ncbi:hypothetical protein [Staphylospora marina]|uniref:hypothetical protein n=1 Tax=Staphylospora marina TaxID=2490858 RepID=UPI000F5BFAD2|nr:hypothetical protein [Staphylospora marina]
MEMWIVWSALLCIGLFWLIKKLSVWIGESYHNKAVHLVILTRNSQHSIEWMIRSYHFWNGAKGKKGAMTCIDTGSTDDTLLILERLKQRYPELEVIRFGPVDGEDAIHEWLQNQDQNREKLIVLDLREPEADRENERHPA